MTNSILLLNASYEILGYIDFNKAATLLAMDRAYVFESVPGKFIHSPSVDIPWPVSIVLSNWVHVPFKETPFSVEATRIGVLRRDGFVCGFCGGKGSTIDHVLPQSRGGLDTWENLITACQPCNNRKDNMTPEEAGMPLLWQPYIPVEADKYKREQRKIHKKLKNA